MTNLDIVLDYAKRGWQVFPLKPQDKAPATGRGGFKHATTNPETLRRWFARGYPYNLGVRTGVASGIVVLDPDGDAGAESLRQLERRYELLPATLISLTGNGRHYWFRTDQDIPSSISRIGDHIDIRSEGGYVVAPPSIHPNGKQYRFLNDLPLAPAPAWLIELAVRKPIVLAPPQIIRPSDRTIISASSGAYGSAALEAEIERLVLASSGLRNHELNRTSFRLHQLVAGAELHGDDVRRRLIEAATANGLIAENGLRAVRATIDSGATAGLKSPRDRGGRR